MSDTISYRAEKGYSIYDAPLNTAYVEDRGVLEEEKQTRLHFGGGQAPKQIRLRLQKLLQVEGVERRTKEALANGGEKRREKKHSQDASCAVFALVKLL